MKSINFSCNGCGGCCKGGVSLTYDEAVHSHSGDFPIAVIFSVVDVRNVPIEKEKTSYAKAMKKNSKENLAFYFKSKDNRKLVVHPEIITLLPGVKSCPNLDWDGKCSIYSRRPKACMLYPFRVDTPELYMMEGVRRERSRSFELEGHPQACQGFDDAEQLIIWQGRPVSDLEPSVLRLRNAEAAFGKNILKQFFLQLAENDEIADKIVEYSELNKSDERVIQASFGKFVRYLIKSGQITRAHGESLIGANKLQLQNQIKDIDAKKDETVYDNFLTHLSEHFL
ncbi:YkgJ family cysteine cluster protein [Vibrio harveyi]|uniref:YkgJ family cysteine cluster protein n=1 Tax=Vibrio harveyi TaxID=669 RepID=UPI003CF57395